MRVAFLGVLISIIGSTVYVYSMTHHQSGQRGGGCDDLVVVLAELGVHLPHQRPPLGR